MHSDKAGIIKLQIVGMANYMHKFIVEKSWCFIVHMVRPRLELQNCMVEFMA